MTGPSPGYESMSPMPRYPRGYLSRDAKLRVFLFAHECKCLLGSSGGGSWGFMEYRELRWRKLAPQWPLHSARLMR